MFKHVEAHNLENKIRAEIPNSVGGGRIMYDNVADDDDEDDMRRMRMGMGIGMGMGMIMWGTVM